LVPGPDGNLAPAQDPNSTVTLLGTNLTTGLSRQLVLRTERWRSLDPPLEYAVVDPLLNEAWDLRFEPTTVRFVMQSSLAIALAQGGTTTIAITPGIYAASIRTLARERVVGDQSLRSETESAITTFSLGPRLASADPPDGEGRIAIHILPAFNLAAPGLRVDLVVGGDAYLRVDAFTGNAAADEGTFTVSSDRVTLQPLFDASVAAVHPVQLIVDGASSQPFWLEG
jgi:hypothetical protein